MKKTPLAQLDELDLALRLDCFQPLPDPRLERRKLHKLVDIVVMGLATLISGGGRGLR